MATEDEVSGLDPLLPQAAVCDRHLDRLARHLVEAPDGRGDSYLCPECFTAFASGRGLPVLQGFGRGNQRVLVNVTVPRQLTEEQRRLLVQFEQLSTEETYRAGEGFFDKLKSAFR